MFSARIESSVVILTMFFAVKEDLVHKSYHPFGFMLCPAALFHSASFFSNCSTEWIQQPILCDSANRPSHWSLHMSISTINSASIINYLFINQNWLFLVSCKLFIWYCNPSR